MSNDNEGRQGNGASHPFRGLAIEASSSVGSVAVTDGRQVLRREYPAGAEQSRLIYGVIRELLEEIVDSLSPPERLRVEIGEGMPVFKADRLQLSQVFSNLIGNSIKYHGGATGHIWIKARDSGDCYEFEVSDDGQGIAPEYHEKVFLMFLIAG